MPQTGWLQTTEIYLLIVLKARSPKQGVHRAALSLWGLCRRNHSSSFSSPGGCRHPLACGHISFCSLFLSPSLCVCLSLLLSYRNTGEGIEEPSGQSRVSSSPQDHNSSHPLPYKAVLTVLPYKVIFIGSKNQGKCVLLGTAIQPTLGGTARN